MVFIKNLIKIEEKIPQRSEIFDAKEAFSIVSSIIIYRLFKLLEKENKYDSDKLEYTLLSTKKLIQRILKNFDDEPYLEFLLCLLLHLF